ncbi:PREDICTED: peritrophin-44-like [Polistes dominula]|uniref:Peritrophin-44-like n=1 Tax=Polistes dominula TaxID=743375 RepID=A0ABM1ITK1_POLDO|nr:PREDICTED: peritrophin-44-like [Polistes dominula]
MGVVFEIIFKVFFLTLWIFVLSVKSQLTCTIPGYYPLEDTTCQYYYHCNSDSTVQIYKCPDGTVFDPHRQACVLPTQYPCILTTPNPYQCLTAGRFPIIDPTCKQFYFCYWNNNGYVKRIYRCPNETIFDPKRQLCVLPTTYSLYPIDGANENCLIKSNSRNCIRV